jgi:parvulin-like peptidyl-prolyl isomerase
LAQKMEFISDGLAESLQPTEEVLKDYYEKHKENYQKDPIYTLQQVYFSNDKRIDAVADATNALVAESPESLGDNISLPNQYTDASAFLIARDYGSAFANNLESLETGKWSGPITSGFGVHIVYVQEKKAAGLYTFKEVANKVKVDYNFDASNEFKAELITTLLKNYKINVDVSDVNLKKGLDEKY